MKPERNAPCTCGSGKKYKHCCEGRAASRHPTNAELGDLVALYNAARYVELELRTRALLTEYPDAGFCWKALGLSLQAQGKDALPAMQRAVELLADDAEAHNNLGHAFIAIGQFGNAIKCYRRVLKLAPHSADAHSNLGAVLQESGQFDEALASHWRALEINPDYAIAHNNLGNTLKALGQLDAAVASFQRAIAIQPNYADAHNNLGVALQTLGEFDAAVACYRRALEINPNDAEAHNNLGYAWRALGEIDSALPCYRKALEINPNYASAHNNLGITLQDIGEFSAALACYRRALEIKPDFAEAHNNLGNVLKDIGQLDEAIDHFRRALEIKPDFLMAHSNLLFALNYSARHTPAYCLEVARRYGQKVSSKVEIPFTAWKCTMEPERLRVGLVSGDLRNHPVGYFLESLLANIDADRIAMIAYSTYRQEDELTARIQPRFSGWKPLFGLSDAAAAQLIHADGLHVLLDISGHTAKNRLPLFAWKPAPIQVTWLGYFATTGVAQVNYLMADEVSVPETQRAHFTEAICYLPDTRWCFTPPAVDLPVSNLPALKNNHLTFGCFQNLAKVGDGVLAAWHAILTALPGARLRWQCKQFGDAAIVSKCMARMQAQGIAPERVSLHGIAARTEYLAAHDEVDVILDTFPFTGGTTTCEALWMGVPTLSLAGDTLVARQGASLLTAVGLQDWIATSESDYVDKAIRHTNDLSELVRLRSTLRARVLASPVYDAPRFARNFEAALWGMWRQHQGYK